MPDPTYRLAANPASTPAAPTPRPDEGPARGPRFAAVLAEGAERGPFLTAVRDAGHRIMRGERTVDRAIQKARAGHVFRHEELLALQSGVYRYTQELELASKVVDKATGAVRHTLQSQR
jgi:hypothetical protein